MPAGALSEADIEGALRALENAIGSDDEKVGVAAVMMLVRCALIDLHRSADALELLARAKHAMTPEINEAIEAACSVEIKTL